MKKYGGKPDVITSRPEIQEVALSRQVDYIWLGTDGIYQKMDA
jgi:hypothetical protein